jgi:hypothetical protein
MNAMSDNSNVAIMNVADLCTNLHRLRVYELGMTERIKQSKQLDATTDGFIQYLIKNVDFMDMLFIYMHIDNWIEFKEQDHLLKVHFGDCYRTIKPVSEATSAGFFRIASKRYEDGYAGFIIMVSRFAQNNVFYIHKG